MANIPILPQPFQQNTNVDIRPGQGVFFGMNIAPGVTIVNGIGNDFMYQTVQKWLQAHPELAIRLVQELQSMVKQDIALSQHIQATKNS